MQQAVSARTPVHLWIVGLLALLFNGFGSLDYTMTNLKNSAWLANMSADQLAFMDSLPGWLTAFWAIGVWGGLVGAILLLMRSRYAVWALVLSCIGAIVGIGYQVTIADMPASMKAGAMALTPWAIILITILLAWYAWS